MMRFARAEQPDEHQNWRVVVDGDGVVLSTDKVPYLGGEVRVFQKMTPGEAMQLGIMLLANGWEKLHGPDWFPEDWYNLVHVPSGQRFRMTVEKVSDPE